MSLPSGITSGMAFLPQWLQETKDSNTWNKLLCEWVSASGWRTAGIVWPTETQPTLAQVVRPGGVETLPTLQAELPDVVKALRGGSGTVIWQLPNSSGRLYTQFQPAGRPTGIVWAERTLAEPWTEADRNYLTLSVRMIERSSALATKIGPIVDAERLLQRLGDASIIAGRMAHDFGNILTGIIGFADLSVPLVGSVPTAAKYISEISKIGQRGIQFTQQLHQLHGSGQAKPQPSSVATVFAKEESRLRSQNPNGVQIFSTIPSQLNPVGIDAAPLGIVLGHVLENAMDASPPSGRVIVSAKAIDLSAADAKTFQGNVSAGSYIEVQIQDFGPGIKPDVRTKLFAEPFFTTKVRHRGLGLAIVYRALVAHGGGIRIEGATPPETGTLARILLPYPISRPTVVQ